ncbi:MAG: hypothetical protein D6744_16410, partial [Planctomycetota bacterium]
RAEEIIAEAQEKAGPLLEEAREKARGEKSGTTGEIEAAIAHDRRCGVTRFVGYDTTEEDNCRVLWVRSLEVPRVESSEGLPAGAHGVVVLDKTPFYAEAGGQVGDTGRIEGSDGAWSFCVTNTKRIGDTIAHFGVVERGSVRPTLRPRTTDARPESDPLPEPEPADSATARAIVDRDRRVPTMKNHTATHVLNWALRETLGDHVDQKGSLVDSEKTRFDFSNPKPVTTEQVAEIERRCAEQIAADHPVYAEEADQAEARKINGLRAVFGEKYPDRVRVVSIGVPLADLLANPDNPGWRRFSIEFCGGTHVGRTREIEDFVIVSEEAVAKGVRRVVGVTGEKARQAIEAGRAIIADLNAALSSPHENLAGELAKLRERLSELQIRVTDRHQALELLDRLAAAAKKQRAAQASAAADVAVQAAEKLLATATKRPLGDSEATIVVGEMPNVPPDQLKSAADFIKQKCGSAVVLFGVRAGEKAILLASMSPDLIKAGLKAGDLVKHAAKLVKGGGGGPPTMAQAGGKNPTKIPDALAAGRAWIEEKLTQA